MTQKQYDKLIDWIADEVSLAMVWAFMRGNLDMTIFPNEKRPDYELARKIAKKLKLKPTP